MATANAQGRAYRVRRAVEGGKAPFVTECREYLLRGQNHVVLVQMIHQAESLQPFETELMRVVRTLEVR